MQTNVKFKLIESADRFDPDGIYEEVVSDVADVASIPSIVGQLITWYQVDRSQKVAQLIVTYINTFLAHKDAHEEPEVYCQQKRLHKHWLYIANAGIKA